MIEALDILGTLAIFASIVMLFMSGMIITAYRKLTQPNYIPNIMMPAERLANFKFIRDSLYIAMGGLSCHMMQKVLENNPLMVVIYISVGALLFWAIGNWNRMITDLEKMVNF